MKTANMFEVIAFFVTYKAIIKKINMHRYLITATTTDNSKIYFDICNLSDIECSLIIKDLNKVYNGSKNGKPLSETAKKAIQSKLNELRS